MAQYLIEHSFLFTNEERESIYRASSDVDTRPVSFVTRLFRPLWFLISRKMLSEQVAPNAITAIGVLSSLQAYQLISTYYHYGEPNYPAGAHRHSVYNALHAFGVRGAGQAPLGETGLGLHSFTGTMKSADNVAQNGAAHARTTYASNNNNINGDGGAMMRPPTPPSSSSPFPDHYEDFFHVNRTVQTATALAWLLMIFSVMCASLDGVHARRCRSATSLGDIFSRACSSLSRIFTALTMLEVMQIDDISTKWYVLLTLQLIEFNTLLGRINAQNIKKDKVKNWAYVATYFFRDSELSFLMVLLLLVRWFAPQIATYLQHISPHYARLAYTTLVFISLANIALLKMKKRYKSSIALCLAVRALPVFYLLPLAEYNTLSVIGDTIVVGLLTIEVYVSHLARRRIHALVILVCVGSLLNDVLAVVASIAYIIGILVDLSYSLNVPLFVPIRNVFIDGVFDLCHAGHKRMMANALKYGNRLIVGVCGDDECAVYKRRPIMSLAERVNEVRLCKYVSEVIPNSPVSGITAEMIKYYNIHVVACGEEYNTPKDTYYMVPRAMGILRYVPRTQGISTSVLIARIRAASEAAVEAQDKKTGKSTVQNGQ